VQYMVIEHFKENCASEIYCRFDQHGRMTPQGLRYIDSWVAADLRVCYQLMETDDFGLFADWTRRWDDLIDFEIVPIIPSGEARSKASARA
jgi:hypothetical protein